ncbi:MAG: TonB-dependent receptor [Sphingobacteriaceae bacterium]|nr:MAG: TonB-dependent receptor [Sphingobacteriaceae bacterium]
MTTLRYFIILFIAFILLINVVYAQTEKGTISGIITDANDLPLVNASIALHGTSIGTVTDDTGNYTLKAPAGNYILIAGYIGFLQAQQTIQVAVNTPVTVSFKLKEEAGQMQEVVVTGVKVKSATATRTLLQIKDIPQAITVIGQKVIKQQAAFDLTTITRNISGLNYTGSYSGGGSSQFFNARGFDLNDAQNYRWNGVMIWNWGNNYADNIEQVEFLKGPTSILFGDVAPGGVMNFVTKKPLAQFAAEVNFKTGSWGLLRPAIDITGPITIDGTVRYRLNTSFEKSNSFRDHVTSQRQFIAPALAWDITPKLALNVEAVFKSSKATDDGGLVSPDGTINGLNSLDPSLYLGEPKRKYLYSDHSYFATLTYKLGSSWSLKAVGFYGDATKRPFGIWFDRPDAAGDFVRREYGFYQKAKNSTVSFDAYGSFNTGLVKHNVLVGVEFQSTRSRLTNGGELSIFDTNNIFNPVYGQVPSIEPVETPLQPYTSLLARRGVYLQDQVMLFDDKIHVLLGIRAGQTKQGNHYYQNQLAGTKYEGYTDDIIAKNIVTPRVGLVYRLKPWSSLYISYAKGYEINSADIFARNYQEYATPPATISAQVEFGAKANLLNDRLGVTLSMFEINKHNPYGYVYLNPDNPNYDEYNVYYEGHHRSQGIEVDIDGKLTPELSLTAGAAYTKTKVIYDPGYPTGNVLPNAPKTTANFWLNYEPLKKLKGFTFGTGVFYKDRFFSSVANDPNLQIPAGYTIDAALGYKHNDISAQLNVMNITNRVSYLNPWQFNLFDVKPLRQFVLTVIVKIKDL